MTAPRSAVDVINLALGQLYQSPITSLNDQNAPQATIANREYDNSRRSLLSQYNWHFAKTRTMINLVASAVPPFDFSWYYALPLDYLAWGWLGYDYRRYWPLPYDIQGQYVLTGPPAQWQTTPPATPLTSLAFKYIQDNTNVSSWRPSFIDCMKYKLAAELCMPITGNRELRDKLLEDLQLSIVLAQKLNHIERPVLITEVNPIADARIATNEIYQLNINPSVWGDDIDTDPPYG